MKPKKKPYRQNLVKDYQSVETKFTGDRKKIMAKISVSDIPHSLLLVGYLEELVCETPVKDKVNAGKLIKTKSGKKPLVCASGDGSFVVIASPDGLGSNVGKTLVHEEHHVPDLQEAIELHTDFHGVSPPAIKELVTDDLTHLEFFGWLKHIVYRVPKYSERAWPDNTPFIHEARDKGDDEPKAKKKPVVCFSPSKDLVIMYGDEMSFTNRGIIG